MGTKKPINFSRRDFIKYSGLSGGALSIAGVAGAGYMAGKSFDSYTGSERNDHGLGQFFNRKPFEVNSPTYQKIGNTRRIENVENIFSRNGEMGQFMRNNPDWIPEDGIEILPESLQSYYKKNPDSLTEFFVAREKSEIQHANWPKYKKRFLLADAWSAAHSAPLRGRGAFPPNPTSPPEQWDFQNIDPEPMLFKSDKHASELIKKIAHSFGATLVGVAKINPDWVYQGRMRGVGNTNFEVPKHWKFGIVVAVPHEWDQLYGNPTYGSSYDGYSRLRQIAGKLEVFIRHIGFSARSHVPPTSYELAMPPLAVDAGLGEQGRMGVLVTPELGANTRLAAITTDMPLQADKPIDVGISKFCKKCKICAEQCPSNAVSFEKEPEVVRGYKRWKVNHDKCFTIWNTVGTSHPRGCRICLAVCPYSRKNNWIHQIAREVDPRDPTGLFSSALLTMQKSFFEYPDVENYLPPPDGKNASYHEGPDWLRTEEW
ncbi:MAG: reductive dehalogenase, partial [Mariniphaga sp.]|nr:reductive dehalogenase [Mariniphaga sp.]